MALNSFGSEISFGTFSNLLAQPVARQRIWRVKILLLAGALLVIGCLWCLFFYLRYAPFKIPENPQNFRDVAVCAWMFLLVVFAGGLWTVLLFRQVAAAFWFTLLVPGMILVLTSSLTTGLSETVAEILLVTVLGSYALGGFWFARWLFLRAQDTQWTGGTIVMPEMRGFFNRFAKSGARRRWCPRFALWRKELQLHQSQLVIAGVLALLHVAVIATRKLGQFPKNSATEIILESFWGLWLVLPLLVGCAAMAEERKMGILETQLCLPVKRRTQFRIKFAVVLIFAVAFGNFVPWLLEGSKVLPKVHPEHLVGEIFGNGNIGHDHGDSHVPTTGTGVAAWMMFSVLKALYPLMPFLFLAAISAGMGTIAFYGSSLARNTLQGLAPSVLGLLLVWFIGFVASMPHEFGLGFLWHGPLFYLIATPVMIAVVVVLAYGNYQRMRITGNVWLKNLLTLVIALAFVTAASSGIYHRAWELLSSPELPHGAPRLTIAHPPRMQVTDEMITLYLPDGRVWMNRFAMKPTLFGAKNVEEQAFGGGKFLDGTNWAGIRDCWSDIVGLQGDGSLWVSKKPTQRHYSYYSDKKWASEITEMERFGDRHDWKNVSGRYLMPFLLRTDGTLWVWDATNRWKWNQKWPGLHAFLPQRLGTDSDWEKIVVNNGRTFLFKTNGQIWVEPPFSYSDATKRLPFGKSFIEIGRAPYLENEPWTAVANFDYLDAPLLVGLLNEGTLRELAAYDRIPLTKENSKTIRTSPNCNFTIGFVARDIQIGQETNWLSMAAGTETAITLKSDGTLWNWTFKSLDDHYRSVSPNPARAAPTRLSKYSDWVAIARMDDGVVSLAADGSLYLWQFESPRYMYNPWPDGSLLQHSRRPIFLGNIFSQPN